MGARTDPRAERLSSPPGRSTNGRRRPVTAGYGSVRTRAWRDNLLWLENFPFEHISDFLQEVGCLVWVDLSNPDRRQLDRLAAELDLHPQAVEDSVAHGERSKASRYATHTFLTVYATSFEDRPGAEAESAPALRTHRISVFVMPQGVVTVREDADFAMDEVVRRWDDNPDLLKHGVGSLVHGLLDVVVDGHFATVEVLDERLEALEDGLFDDRADTSKLQHEIDRIRKDLVELRRVVLPMREVVNAVLRHRKDLLGAPSELDAWFDDLYDHVLRASEWTESLRDLITTMFETSLSLQDARLNTVMKQLTGWAAIIAVPTAVTGYFGQNLPYPGFAQRWGYALSDALIVGLAFVLFVVFRRRKWL